jgi:hypothetical protein
MLVEVVRDKLHHNIKLKDMVDINGEWKWSWLEGLLPNIMSENCKFATILPLDSSAGEDEQIWPGNNTNTFSITAMYHVICDFDRAEEDIKWKSVWKLKVPERVKYFIWMMMMHGVGYLQTLSSCMYLLW